MDLLIYLGSGSATILSIGAFARNGRHMNLRTATSMQ